MSAKLELFNDIVTELEKISEVETIQLWNSQLANENEEIPFNFPAVFIEFSELAWTSTNLKPSRLGTQGNVTKEQEGEGGLIILHIAFSRLENETISFPIIDPVIDKVYFAIQGLKRKERYTSLLRVSELQDTDHGRVIDWQMGFSTMLFQCGELDTTLTEIPGGTLDVDVNVDLDIEPATQKGIRTGDGQ